MTTKFTILLPTHRNPRLLPFSIQSVLAQTETSFELFIVCDGAPSDGIAFARDFEKRDSRIKVFEFEKGERFGEAHRHQVLMQAQGKFVAHIQDDDLWFPNHLKELDTLLQTVDFGNLLHVYIDPNNEFHCVPGHLGDKETISRIAAPQNNRFNVCGLSVTGYRLAAYHQLPVGWSPAPLDIWTDLFMWKKFLNQEGLKFGSRIAVTSIKFPGSMRQIDSEQLEKEVRKWHQKIQSELERDDITQKVLKSLSNEMLINQLKLEERNHSLRMELAIKNNDIHILLNYVNVLLHSFSWKITWPLRFIKKWIDAL